MTQSVLEDKNWLEFWKQGWRIHCGAASEGSQEEVEAHPGGPAGATPGAERESRCASGQPEDSNGLCVQQGLGEWRGEDAPRSSHPAAPPALPSTAAPLEPRGDFLQERQMFLDAAGY